MGKKGTWISAIKSLFTSNNKLNNEGGKGKQKKGLRGKLRHGPSFIPRFREPSSIEKILGEVDQQNSLYINTPPTQPQTLPSSSSPTITSPPPTLVHHPPTETTQQQHQQQQQQQQHQQQQQQHQQQQQQQHHHQQQQQHHLSATKIQAAYRGYMARKKTKTKPSTSGGLKRLQGVVRGQQVKRQTANAMKQMQLLVRLQTQIHSRRIQMLPPLKHQPNNNNNNNKQQDNDDDECWDDSLITKEEREARLQRKAEALINRDRAMTYAYSHQLWKSTPPKNSLPSPWWWSRLERHFPCHDDVKNPPQSRPTPNHHHPTKKQTNNNNNNRNGSASPMSSRSMVPPRTRMKHPYPIKDDDSLMSCPAAFSVPNYMTPTLSAKAKARPSSNPRDRMPTTPTERRLSFPPTPNSNASSSSASAFYWKKGSTSRNHKSPASVGELSTDSAISSSVLGRRRKAFNRFV